MGPIVLLTATPAGGYYFAAWKLIPPLLLLIGWLKLMTWVDKDAPVAFLPREKINAGNVCGLAVGYALFFLLPNFFIALLALLLTFGAEVGVYLFMRQQKVGLTDLKGEIANIGSGFKRGGKDVKEVVGSVQFVGKGGALLAAPATETPEAATYAALQTLLADPLKKQAERIDLVPSDGGLSSRYLVDGVGYRGAEVPRDTGAAVITQLKDLAGMDVNDKRKPQVGVLKLMAEGKKMELQVKSRGSTAGEQMTLRNDPKKQSTLALDQLGLTEVQLQLVRDTVQANAGIVILAAPKEQGLSTLAYAILRAHDAFLTHIHTIERAPDVDLEGVTQNKLPAQPAPGEEAKMVSWVSSQEPDTLMLLPLEEPKSAVEAVAFAKKGRRVYVGLVAGSTSEAISQWRKLVGDDKLALDQTVLVICSRVVRKLCSACKVAYKPDPVTLRKLGMDPDKVSTLYQARTAPPKNEKGEAQPCQFCNELHFKGRTGVYEIFVIDDDAKTAILSGSSTQLKMAFRKQRAKYMQEQALTVVEAGETSVQEVLRVLKPESSSSSGSSKVRKSAPA